MFRLLILYKIYVQFNIILLITTIAKMILMTKRLDGKRALITGATKGIGRAVAEQYAREGAHLILTGRDVGALESLDDKLAQYNVDVTLVPMDLKEFNSIDHLAQQIWQRYQGLDILVGNAGILGDLTPMPHLKPNIWQDVIDVNLTANWRLMRAFDLMLQQSPSGRALFVTSGSGETASPYWSAYTVSKKALEECVKTYAQEVTNPAFRVNLVNPGAVQTNMYSKAFPGDQSNSSATRLPEDVTEVFVYAASDACHENGVILNIEDFKKLNAI